MTGRPNKEARMISALVYLGQGRSKVCISRGASSNVVGIICPTSILVEVGLTRH